MSLGNTLKSRRGFKAPALQITSMMDMFTIIVFFLLFSYSDKPDEFDLGKGLELPSSNVQIDYKNSLKLFISPESIRINNTQVSGISNLSVVKLDPANLQNSDLYKNIVEHKKNSDSKQSADKKGTPETQHILVFCDQRIPFKTLNLIIKTAGLAGYTNFQLAVTEA